MIEVNNIKKIYKLSKKQAYANKSSRKIAVNGVSFNAEDNEIFGLLGPNGAGKTTILRCISTLIKPTEGDILIDGYDVVKDSKKVRARIAFLTTELKLDNHFTPRYTMEYFGKLYGLTKNEIEHRIDLLFNEFGIKEFQHTKISELSTGMKQKISIAVSLVHDPDIIVFDEPTNGLDIITARSVTEYLKQLKEEGKTLIISTHIMSVASNLCDRIAILIDGEVTLLGTQEYILDKTETTNLEDAFFSIYNKVKKGDIYG